MQPQWDVDAMEVDPPEVSDPCIVEVVADQTTANRADNLSDSVSDSEVRGRVAILRKQKKKTQLRAKLEHLERKKAGRFVDKRHQIDGNEHACQLSLKHSKCIQDPNVYLTSSQRKLTVYLSQVDNIFRQKPITYFTKMNKVLFAANYLAGVIKNEWKSENEQITVDLTRSHTYARYCEFLQKRIKPAHIC